MVKYSSTRGIIPMYNKKELIKNLKEKKEQLLNQSNEEAKPQYTIQEETYQLIIDEQQINLEIENSDKKLKGICKKTFLILGFTSLLAIVSSNLVTDIRVLRTIITPSYVVFGPTVVLIAGLSIIRNIYQQYQLEDRLKLNLKKQAENSSLLDKIDNTKEIHQNYGLRIENSLSQNMILPISDRMSPSKEISGKVIDEANVKQLTPIVTFSKKK
jgi:hypothetical protein